MDAFCLELPKIELHAHLNGSLDIPTMKELRDLKKDRNPELMEFALPEIDPSFKIEDFFPFFKFIYLLTNDVESVAFVTRRVIEAFALDGVRYLELRSTPRRDDSTGMTKVSYIETILDTIDEMTTKLPEIIVKLILSIDRRHTLEESLDTLDLAICLKDRGVVGIDVCGDPTTGSFEAIKPAVLKAKSQGLKVTIHLGEVQDTEEESLSMMDCKPDRLGHATYLSPQVRARILSENIPVEMCMTSNVICKTVRSYEDHHIRDFFPGHPCVLCTDDMGIFASKLSNEYAIAAKTFGMNKRQLFELSKSAIDCVFGDEDVKQNLRAVWEAFGNRNLSS